MRASTSIRSLVVFAVLGALATAGPGCRKRTVEQVPPLTLAPLTGVELAGCAAIVRGSEGALCEQPDDGTLRVAVSATSTRVKLGAIGATVRSVPIGDDGRVFRVVVSEGARTLLVEATEGGARKGWSIPLRPRTRATPVVAEARALWERGQPEDAAATLERGMRESSDERGRTSAESLLARVLLSQGAAASAAEHFSRTMEAHADAGRVSSAADDAFARVFLLIDARRFVAARALIARAAEWSNDYYEGRFMARFYEGALARETGDARTALRALENAEAMAERLDLARLAGMATIDRAIALHEVGRTGDALGALGRLEPWAKLPACERLDVLSNAAWFALVAIDARGPDPALPDARALLTEALGLSANECKDSRREGNVRTNVAWAALQAGDLAEARAELARARVLLPDPEVVLERFWSDLEGRIALAEGNGAAALAAYDELARLTRRESAWGDAWRAADGRAAALSSMGRMREALNASAEAERLLDEESRGVPLGEGRSSMLGARERSARRRVELLLVARKPDLALAAARAARVRVIADLERSDRVGALDATQRRKWEESLGEFRAERDALARAAAGDRALSAEGLAKALAARQERERGLRATFATLVATLPKAPLGSGSFRAPAGGERLVAYFPLLRGWIALVAGGNHVTAVRLGDVDPRGSAASLGHALLDPIRASLEGATRITVLAHGALADVDVHALPLAGAPLVSIAPVDYALDIGVSSGAGTTRRALVVADPTSDLAHARSEGRSVASKLPGAVLLEGNAATRTAVQSALEGVAFFHYAGHGVFGGAEGWASELPLARSSLSVADILALAKPPREIVLSACDGARAADSGQAPALGIAQAFLAAGTESIVASTRTVDDAVAAEIVAALYDARGTGATLDLAASLRAAQLAVADHRDARAWGAFRALSR
jgi:tetratricopeptide (TPR) repeat protein